MNCYFCDFHFPDVKMHDLVISKFLYKCPVCGPIRLTEEAADDFEGERFSERDKKIISCVLRNRNEAAGYKLPDSHLEVNDLHRIVDQYTPLTPLDKMNHVLQRIGKLSNRVGEDVEVNDYHDYTLFHCFHHDELNSVLNFLESQELISLGASAAGSTAKIMPKGYDRLQQLQQIRQDSTTCFVAMWFNPAEMDNVYKHAIKLAIEYKEEGKVNSRFKAVKINDVEHINDINDEIIATIRRSRFMVCDLTGYRGGVYFEAGFAHGLGIPVIYTCRDDWCHEDKLRDDQDKEIETLKDRTGRAIRVRKEGVHFDLAHRNRISWSDDKLDKFKVALENRIKAVIL